MGTLRQGVTGASVCPEDKEVGIWWNRSKGIHTAKEHAKELIQTADWLSVHGAGEPTGLQKTVNNHRDRLSSFHFSLFCFAYWPPELGGMFIFSMPCHIASGLGQPCLVFTTGQRASHFWRLWQNLMLVFINACAQRLARVSKAAEGATLMMRRGFQESRISLAKSPCSSCPTARKPMSPAAKNTGAGVDIFCPDLECWPDPLLATSNSITKTILEFRKFLSLAQVEFPQK